MTVGSRSNALPADRPRTELAGERIRPSRQCRVNRSIDAVDHAGSATSEAAPRSRHATARSVFSAVLAGAAAFATGCGSSQSAPAAVPAFAPVVAMNANLSASEPVAAYSTEYRAIHALGARGAHTAAAWSALNPTGTTYDLTLITNPFFGLSALQGYGFSTILVNVPIVAIAERKLPADLAGAAFNDAAVKARYRALIDQLLPYLNDSVKYFSLGNEVDTYFATRPAEWAQYKELVEDARAYLKARRPGIEVGVTTTFAGATSTHAAEVSSLNQNMDVLILTYYPVSNSFVARDPSSVRADMQSMVDIAGGKNVVVQEWGYPSSTVIAGSPQRQADFVAHTFAAWRLQGTAKIPFVSFFKRRDWDDAHCRALTGQTAGQNFYEFMCSLGLLNNDGSPKPAYTTLQSELGSR